MQRWFALAGLLAALAPAAAQTPQNVAPRRLMFVVGGAFNRPFRNPAGVWYDVKQQEIFVADPGNHRIVILRDTGAAKAEFVHYAASAVPSGGAPTSSFPAGGEPSRIAVDSRGTIYVVDNMCPYLDVCDYRGRSTRRIYLRDHTAGAGRRAADTSDPQSDAEFKPTAVHVDGADNVFVATSSRIYQFSSRGALIRVMGGSGSAKTSFQAITGLWVDGEGLIFVTDARGTAVRMLSPFGEVLLAFGEHDSGFSNFSLPVGIAVDRRGAIWVADSLRHIVSAFKREDGKSVFLDYIGAYGDRPGAFAYPSAVFASTNGRLIVVDRVGARLQCFEL